jgi:hypothetical protein
VVLQLDQFDSALPTVQGDITVELLAHLRNSGRALDHFRFSLNGSTPLEATVGLDHIIPVPDFTGWNITQQLWARNIPLRRNMTTSAWVSITDTMACNDCDITAPAGVGIPAAEFTRKVVGLPGNRPANASTRWAVVIGEDLLLCLQWQALPRPASVLNGRATFKRYVTVHQRRWNDKFRHRYSVNRITNPTIWTVKSEHSSDGIWPTTTKLVPRQFEFRLTGKSEHTSAVSGLNR